MPRRPWMAARGRTPTSPTRGGEVVLFTEAMRHGFLRTPPLPAHEALRVAHPGDRETANVGHEFMRKVAAGTPQKLGNDDVGDCCRVIRCGENLADPVGGNQAARLVFMRQAHPRITGRIEAALPRQSMMDEAEPGYAGIGVFVSDEFLNGNSILAY